MKFWLLWFCLAFVIRVPGGEWMKFPAYERTVLPNGVTLLVLEKHDAPLINLNLALRSGSTQDAAGHEGLAEVTNELLRKGAGTKSASQISEELDTIGASLETATSLELTRLELDFLAKDLPAGLDLFSDLVLHPVFPANEVEKLVGQKIDEIKAGKDEPLHVVGSYYRQFLFRSHPYGRPHSGDEESLGTLKRDEIVRFHRETYVASNIVLIAAGDFAGEEMKRLLSTRFGKLPAKGLKRNPVGPPPALTKTRLLLVDKSDATQTVFAIGSIGIAMQDPDRLALSVANTLFGGRFTSRLNTALRIDSGLSYGARSAFTPARNPGDFTIVSYTRNDATEQALDGTLETLQKFYRDGVTAVELESAKAYLKGQFGPTLETPSQLTAQLAIFEVFGLSSREEVDEYATRLDALTLDDIRRVIRKTFPQGALAYAIIGNGTEIKTILRKFSKDIESISITAPGFGRK